MHKGLTKEQIEKRIQAGQVNKQDKDASLTISQIIKENAFTLFNALNVLIALALVYVQAWSNLFFIVIIIANIAIGILQEIKAKRMIEKLSILVSPKQRVLREGKEQTISASDIVLDDIIVLKQGDQISCDAIVLEGNLEVNESLLTGESDAIVKNIEDSLYSGSYVISGSALCKVIHVGQDNYANKLANQASVWKPVDSELLNAMKKVTQLTCVLIVPLGIVLFLEAYFGRSEEIKYAVINSAAALLGMLPKGLVLLTSVSLAAGIVKMGQKKILVQRLYALESLAHVDTLCLDKTGTLTTGKMKLEKVVEIGLLSERDRKLIASYMFHCEDSNSTFEAISNHFESIDYFKPKSIIPFSSNRKWGAINFEEESIVLGAPDRLWKYMPQQAGLMMDKGYRVIGLAKTKEQVKIGKPLPNLEGLLLIVLKDELRENCQETIERFSKEGVEIKIISGDHIDAVSALAQQAKVPDAKKCVDLSLYDEDADYDTLVKDNVVFGRVSPDQKKWLVEALQRQNKKVAMTGDGVNDILALRQADCSIAVAQGNDAVKQVSEIVLLESSFKNLADVLFEGRRVVNNVTRVAGVFFIKTMYSIFVSVLCAISVLAGVENSFGFPFIPIQITLLDLVMEAWPSFATMMEPNYQPVKEGFLRTVLRKALPFSIVISIYVFLFQIFGQGEHIETIQYYGVAYITMYAVIKSCVPLNKLRAVVVVLMVFGFSFSMILFPNLFHISFGGWFVVGASLVYLLMIFIFWHKN